MFDNSGSNRTGNYFPDYRYRFYDQNNQKLTVSLDFKALNAPDKAAGTRSFLSGNNNSYTVFVNVNGVSNEIAYKAIAFYSGRITETGIEGFQTGVYFTEKGPDPGNKLMKVGSSRILNDEDEFSDMNEVFRGIRSKSTLVGSK